MTVSLVPDDPSDRALVALVRPADWVNPPAAKKYHLVVVGGGTAGLVSAAGAAGLGARVALVERDLLGGDCLNVGCVPSKALLAAARAVRDVREASTVGVHVGGPVSVDFPAIMERMRRLRAGLSANDSAERFRGLGVDVFLGAGVFAGPDALEVGGQRLRFHRAIIATGARAATPPIPGLAEAGYLTNESVFALTALPARLAVLGGGPIGCELAQAFARFGSRVSLLQEGPRLLPREDADMARRVEASLTRDGVSLFTSAKTLGVRRDEAGKHLRLEEQEISCDEILVATGRRPNVEGMGFEMAGVQFDAKKGVTVDDRLRTTNPRIYAAGDVCSRYQFTHAADAMARLAIQNALFWGRAKASALTIPWCTYTDPELARVGLSQEEAKAKDIPFQVFTQELSGVDRAVLEGETEGVFQVLVVPGTDRILGASIVARHAGDTIGEMSLAMTNGLRLGQFARTIHPYPTQAEAFRKLGDAYNRTRLTALARWVLGKWLGLWA